ncbi:MAG: ABC transporter ATP-binding protein [Desulfobacterales bacterium]|jgi:branched-chain amino acid transport system permease protein|nr:ABC transporter ATP-binding protein [Desulfobacterales bacterium]
MNDLRVNNLSRRFGGLQALLEVSFEVTRGTVHGLIGPNGAGKTTLINILSGVLSPTSGEVFYRDQALHRLPAHRVAAVGVARTFQNIRLFPTMTCLENVQAGHHLTARRPLLPRLLRLPSAGREDRQLAVHSGEILARVGLGGKASHLAKNLSYGERRRLEIARALSFSPSLLLLDEPVAGMRRAEAAEVANLVRSLAGEGMTILLIEHNMAFVMNLCSRITVLNFGRVITTGSPEEVRGHREVVEAYLGSGDPHA